MPKAKTPLRRRMSLLIFLCFVMLATSQADSASACLELPPHPPDVWVSRDACEDGELIVTIHDYSTFAASNDFCACALNLPIQFGTVIAADVIDRATGQALPEFAFIVDPDAVFGASTDWQGLATGLTTINPGLSVDLQFRVIPSPKFPCEDSAEILVGALESPPDPGLVGTGGADTDGVPTHHIGITEARSVAIAAVGTKILNQPPNGGCAVVSDAGVSVSLAENFVIAPGTNQRVRQLIFTGAYLFSNMPPVTDSFEVNIYPDSGGLPGPAVVSGCHHPSVAPTSRTLTGRAVGDFEIYELTLDLADSCVLTAGGSYWLEIFEALPTPDHFSWECGNQDPVNGLPGVARASTNPGIDWKPIPGDYSVMIVTAPPDAFGLPHEALGDAMLGLDSSANLRVSNLGSSGEDGVRISLGAAESHAIGFEPIAPAPQLPDGSFMQFITVGELDGVPEQQIWSVQVEDLGDQFGLSIDAARVQPGSLRVEARLGGAVVDSRVFAPFYDHYLIYFLPEGCYFVPFLQVAPVSECWAFLALEQPSTVMISGSEPVVADEIVIASVEQQSVVGSLSSTLMQASDIESFTIFEESLRMFDLPHNALGMAMMEAQGDQMTISNLGSSGEDGVRIRLEAADFFNAQLDPITLEDEADQLTLGATGLFGGNPDAALGEASITRVGGNLEINTDYASLGADTVRIEVFAKGTLVGTTTVPDGMVGEVLGPPPITGCGKVPVEPEDLPCFHWDFYQDVTFVASDSTQFVGDEIRLLAANPSGTLESLSSFSIEATGVPSMTITGESTVPEPPSSIFSDGFESGDTSAW